jgi:hypothetical protein
MLSKLCAQALPELLLVSPTGTRQFGEHFERAQQLGIVDNYFGMLLGTGYPPKGLTPVLDRWGQKRTQIYEDLQQRALMGNPEAQRLLWGHTYADGASDQSDVEKVVRALDVFCAQQFISRH